MVIRARPREISQTGIRVRPREVIPQEGFGFLDRTKQFGQGALSGFLRPALEEAGQQAQMGVMDIGRGGAIPISQSAAMANIPQRGVEALESARPQENDSLGNILHHAGEFGGGIASFPMLPSQTVGSAGRVIGNFAKGIGGGTAIGAGSGALQQAGVNPLTADIGTAIVAPSTAIRLRPQSLLENFRKLGTKVAGLTGKNFNKEAAIAARDLGIDLPATPFTKSTLTGLADQLVSKTPILGNKLHEKYAKAGEQTKGVLEDIYNKVGSKKTPEIEAKISKLYDRRAKELPEGAAIHPSHTKKAIDKIDIDTATLSPDEKSLIEHLNKIKSDIEPSTGTSKFGDIKVPLQDYSIKKLAGTKKSLNSIIKWDMDEGVKNQLRGVQKGIAKDIEEYGKKNPKWYKTFKKADEEFGKVARREQLEQSLSGKAINTEGQLSYNALSKAINDSKKNGIIKKKLDTESYEKIQKLGEVAKAMTLKQRAIPNPSGTAPTAATLTLIGGLFTAPVPTIATFGGIAGVNKLLTDKKFLDLAIKLSEQPNNKFTANAINKRIENLTGKSITVINNEIERNKKKEGKE